MPQYHVGIDLHKTVAQVCVLNVQGEVLKEWRHPVVSEAEACLFLETLVPYGADGLLVVEAVGCNRWFVDRARAAGLSVVIAHPAALQLKSSGRKTDRRDARELARRLYLGDVQRNASSYYATDLEYGRRKVLRVRHGQVQRRQEAVNQVRAILSAFHVVAPRGGMVSKRNLAWLRGLQLPNADVTLCLQVLVDDIVALQAQIARLDEQIESWASDAKLKAFANTLPVAGMQTAATLVSELGDVSRFEGPREATAFSGLAPRVGQSGEGKPHHGSITKRGNPELRWILSQWAVRLLTQHPVARQWAKDRRSRVGKNKLRTALARRLLVGVYHCLSRGEVFSLERCLATKKPQGVAA